MVSVHLLIFQKKFVNTINIHTFVTTGEEGVQIYRSQETFTHCYKRKLRTAKSLNW